SVDRAAAGDERGRPRFRAGLEGPDERAGIARDDVAELWARAGRGGVVRELARLGFCRGRAAAEAREQERANEGARNEYRRLCHGLSPFVGALPKERASSLAEQRPYYDWVGTEPVDA